MAELMIRTTLITLAVIVISEGAGSWFERLLGIDRKGFSAPIGFAVLMACLQVLAYPAQIGNWSFLYLLLVTLILFAAAIWMTCWNAKEAFRHFRRKETFIVLFAGLLFLYLASKNLMVSAGIPGGYFHCHANEIGSGLFQVYPQFLRVLTWLNELPHLLHLSSIPADYIFCEMVGGGLLFAVISSMFIVNVVRSFHLRNHWLEFSIIAFMLTYENYVSWHLSTAYLGTAWSELMMAEGLFVIWRWHQESNEQIKYLLIPVLMAGLAFDNGFGLAGIAILYGLTAYQLRTRTIRCFFELFSNLAPYVLYSAALLSRTSEAGAWILFLFYLAFLFFRYRKPFRRWITLGEEWLFDHGDLILFGIIPAAAAGLSLYLSITEPWAATAYSYYFQDFTEVGDARDYLFIHSSWLEIVLNIFRWGGLVLLIIFAKTKDEQIMRVMMITTLLVFLNPLCTPFLTYITGPAFYRTFTVLFNPFTETVMFLKFYHLFEWNAVGQWILELVLCLAAFMGLITILF